jgi:hypothetical protein
MQWAEFHRFAAGPGRFGAVSVLDGRRFGISPGRLRSLARSHGWEQPYRGVVLLPGSRDTFWRRHAAALLAVGGTDWSARQVAMAGWAAAYANGLIDRPKPLLELTKPHRLRAPQPAGIATFRSRHLRAEDIGEVERLPCTTAARTIRDLAWRLDVDALRDLAIDGIQRGLLDVAGLVEQSGTLGSRNLPARRRFDRLLAQLGERRVDSTFEWEVRQALEEERGLQPWPEPFPWRCRDGVLVHLDIAFPWAWLAIECDGRAKYRLGADFSLDRVRWSAISRDWQIVWLDWRRWRRDRSAVLDDIAERLRSADRARAPAEPAGRG